MDANQRAEKFVLENELSRATPTIQKAAENIRYTITNICGSYGGTLVKEHEACAAIDVVKEGNVWEQKEYLESFDLVCESHFNYSGAMSKIDSPDSHFHCVDKYFLEQSRRSVKKNNVDDHVNEVLSYAYEISDDKDFVRLLVAENGRVQIDTIGITGDIGFCQVSSYYHPKIVNDPRFLTDWKWQIDQCYNLYKNGTTFHGASHLYRADGLITFS